MFPRDGNDGSIASGADAGGIGAYSIGSDACDGCVTPMCLVFSSNKVTTPIAANDRKITGPTNGVDSDYAVWQGGGVPVTYRGTGCPAATPTRNVTWSAVKTLYR